MGDRSPAEQSRWIYGDSMTAALVHDCYGKLVNIEAMAQALGMGQLAKHPQMRCSHPRCPGAHSRSTNSS